VIADAFTRIAKAPLEGAVPVAASPEDGYRLRARLHVQESRWGFLREGTRALCDAAATGQLLPSTVAALEQARELAGPLWLLAAAVVVAENIDASERVLHFELRPDARMPEIENDPAGRFVEGGPRPPGLFAGLETAGVTGVTAGAAAGLGHVLTGDPRVRDTARAIFGATSPIGAGTVWSRRATSFFQANRHLVGSLLRRALEVCEGDRIVDLYSGVGLFAVALAARGAQVTAVEGDESSGTDLTENARPFAGRLTVVRRAVEDVVTSARAAAPDLVVLDPPRTGASPVALGGVINWRAPRVVYVSCDPPTLARDSARLIASGYRLQSVEAFDLFPNTPHVECLAVFTR
jgi:23S rRNA (uracil1939-C5)-methyltransferase